MKHLVMKPGENRCLEYSVAMLLGCTVKELESGLGNLGQCKVWDLPEPYCRRSYHIQEIINYALKQGYTLTPFCTEYTILPTPPHIGAPIINKLTRAYAQNILTRFNALLIKPGHAMAWNHLTSGAYEPNGAVWQLSQIWESLTMFFICNQISPRK